jgi:hypothetical protein
MNKKRIIRNSLVSFIFLSLFLSQINFVFAWDQKPDLTITNVVFSPTQPEVGDTLRFYVTIKNIGSNWASNIAVLVRDQQGWGNQSTISSLSPYQSKTVTVTLYVREIHATYNPHYFTIKVDPLNTIQETNESNNQSNIALAVLTQDSSCPSCQNECSYSGQKRCSDTYHYQTCGNYDCDSCLEWSTPQRCPMYRFYLAPLLLL